LMLLRKGPIIAALYPIGMLLAQLGVALLAARLVGGVLALTGLPYVGWLGLGVVWPILHWFRKQDGRLYAYYLMHDYAYSARRMGANPPELEVRMDEFRAQIADALNDPALDEVLVVGHSSGAHLAVSILADLIRNREMPERGPALSFLSLGQVVPMVSFLPRATRLRTDLHFLAARPELTWVDVTAPGE
ncbi:hypothetical protein HA397_28885, partial [Escherichia coli]|nr:hypothetical protein [Escherichia coli]